MAEKSENSQYLMITKAFVELDINRLFYEEKLVYWEFDLGGATLGFAKHYTKSRTRYWEFHEFDSSKDLLESVTNLIVPSIVVIGGSLYVSVCKILNFLVCHMVRNAIFIFEEWSDGVRAAVEEFEEENPTIILKEIFSIGERKAFQVRDV